jgi:hypothetical protein
MNGIQKEATVLQEESSWEVTLASSSEFQSEGEECLDEDSRDEVQNGVFRKHHYRGHITIVASGALTSSQVSSKYYV